MSRPLGITTVMILTAIDRGVRYGLDIVNRTEMLAGTVYTTLRRLERRGMVEGRWEDPAVAEAERRPRRRYYQLTRAGSSALQTACDHFESMGVEIDLDLSIAGE